MFSTRGNSIYPIDSIDSLKSWDKLYIRSIFLATSFVMGLFLLAYLGQKVFESTPPVTQAFEAGLPHIYGPVPLEAQLRESYEFYGVHLRHGAFGPIELDRISEITKDQFKSLVLQNVPTNLRERLALYTPMALGFAEQYQVDPFWVLAVMWTESHFNPEAQSHMNAQGLMQILPGTGAFIYQLLDRPVEHMDRQLIRIPQVNIEMGVFYLKRLINRFDGNYRLATAAYNMGTTRVLRRLRQGLPVGVNNLYLNKVRAAYSQLIVPFKGEVMSRPNPYLQTYVAYPRFREHREVMLSSLIPLGNTPLVPFSMSYAPIAPGQPVERVLAMSFVSP